MTIDLVAASILVLLLALEWRYRRTTLRLATIGAALAVLWLTGVNYTNARRAAAAVPTAERTLVVGGDTWPEYFAGVEIALDNVKQQRRATWPFRALALGMLVWLAITPAVRRADDGGQGTAARSEGAG